MRVQHGTSGLTLVQTPGQVSELRSMIPISEATIPYQAGSPTTLTRSLQGIMSR